MAKVTGSNVQPGPMPEEPGILAYLERCAAFYPPGAVDAPVAKQREWYDALCAAFAAPSPPGLRRQDSLHAGRIALRRYTPANVATETRILYIHGGGFVVGSLDSHDPICAELAHAAKAELVSVDYRLAPEHVWPAAFDDCWEVLRALLEERQPVIVAGDSAGGNLAAGIALKARDEGLKGVAGQALVYPALGGDLVSGSYVEMAEAPGLTTADVRYYRDVLKAPPDDPHAHPLRAGGFSGLPPAFITVARFDPLADDGRDYAARLREAGVEAVFREEPQMVHGWLRARHMSDGAREGFRQLCAAVGRMAGTA